MKTRRQKLDQILRIYIKAFEKKHGREVDHVVVDDLMGTISFGDVYYFHISDIVYDIDNRLKKRLIFHWMDYILDHEERGHIINLRSYAKGARYDSINRTPNQAL